MDKQKIIEDRIREFLRGKKYPDHMIAKIPDLAEYLCMIIFPNIDSSNGLGEVRAALGLPDDTPEPLVGVIWRLQQRIEELEGRVEGEGSKA